MQKAPPDVGGVDTAFESSDELNVVKAFPKFPDRKQPFATG
jgi:hypothetical protein